jgi:phage shock protein A
MQARAGALDELLASGALDEPGQLGRGDDIQAELDRLSSGSDVELELARMKGELPSTAARPAIEGQAATAEPQQQPQAAPAETEGEARP